MKMVTNNAVKAIKIFISLMIMITTMVQIIIIMVHTRKLKTKPFLQTQYRSNQK